MCVCYPDASINRVSCAFSFLLDVLILVIFFSFFGSDVCVKRMVLPSIGLVCASLPSSYQPKLSDWNDVDAMSRISLIILSPSFPYVSDVACCGVRPVCVSVSDRCTTPASVCVALLHLRVAIFLISVFPFRRIVADSSPVSRFMYNLHG